MIKNVVVKGKKDAKLNKVIRYDTFRVMFVDSEIDQLHFTYKDRTYDREIVITKTHMHVYEPGGYKGRIVSLNDILKSIEEYSKEIERDKVK
jgi:hypothetical protein